jgi:N-acyl-D-amino-acid deacylase
MNCDLLIKDAMILDGTGTEAFHGNLAVSDGRIAAVGTFPIDADAGQVIDARKLTVSPGFIDVHTHADFVFASPEHHALMEPFVRQGITTMVTGNCGFSPAPINHDYREQLSTYWNCILPDGGLSWKWKTMADFLGHLESVAPVLNIAQLVGHGVIRINLLGYVRRRPSADELRSMRDQVRRSVEEGAHGLSFGLGYIPGVWADTEELIEVARDLSEYKGRITVHMRNQSGFIGKSVEEMIRVAETTDVPLQLSHYVPFDAEYIEQFYKSYEATEAARERGVEIGYDMLPYAVASTTVCMLYPPWMFEDGMERFFGRLEDSKIRERLQYEFRHHTPVWPSWETGTWPAHEYSDEVGWSRHRIFGFRRPEYRRYEGMNLQAIADDLNKDPFETLFDITIEERGRIYYTSGFYDDEGFDMALGGVLSLPHMSFMTDAVGIGRHAQHPSHYGTFPRFLGRHVRKWETYTLEEAVRKCTSLPAAQLGLKGRGVIQDGASADIVIFDADRIIDKASFAEPFQYAEGVETVIINGVPVWHEGRYRLDAAAGQVIRRE